MSIDDEKFLQPAVEFEKVVLAKFREHYPSVPKNAYFQQELPFVTKTDQEGLLLRAIGLGSERFPDLLRAIFYFMPHTRNVCVQYSLYENKIVQMKYTDWNGILRTERVTVDQIQAIVRLIAEATFRLPSVPMPE